MESSRGRCMACIVYAAMKCSLTSAHMQSGLYASASSRTAQCISTAKKSTHQQLGAQELPTYHPISSMHKYRQHTQHPAPQQLDAKHRATNQLGLGLEGQGRLQPRRHLQWVELARRALHRLVQRVRLPGRTHTQCSTQLSHSPHVDPAASVHCWCSRGGVAAGARRWGICSRRWCGSRQVLRPAAVSRPRLSCRVSSSTCHSASSKLNKGTCLHACCLAIVVYGQLP